MGTTTYIARGFATAALLASLVAAMPAAASIADSSSAASQSAIAMGSEGPVHATDPRSLSPREAALPNCNTSRSSSPGSGPTTPDSPPPADFEPSCKAPAPTAERGPERREPNQPSPQPSSASGPYFHRGMQSTEQIDEVYGQIDVDSTSVPHDSSFSYFTVARFMVKSNDADVNWLEAGWGEVSWRNDDQYVYTYDTIDRRWNFYDSYNIGPTDDIFFWLDKYSCNAYGLCTYRAYIHWNGGWQLLDSVADYFGAPTTPLAEAYVEVYDNGSALPWYIGSIDMDNIQVHDDGAWAYWRSPPISTAATTGPTPYCATFDRQYDDFRVAKC